MKLSALAVLSTLCLAGPAFAQAPAATPTPAASPAAGAESPPAAATHDDGKVSAKVAREECRNSAKSEGLKGADRAKAVSDCFKKQRPDLAQKEDARVACMGEAKTKGLDKDARRSFMKECMKGKM